MKLRARREHGSQIKGLLPLHSGGFLSWSYQSHDVCIWDASGDLLHHLRADAQINGALELRDGRILAWAEDRRIRLWQADGILLATTERHHGQITGVLELNDGRLLSWGDDHKPRLWSSIGGPIRLLAAHGGHVYGMLEMKDGRLLSWASHSYPMLWSAGGDRLQTLREWHFVFWPFFFRLRDGSYIYWPTVNELHRLEFNDGQLLPRPEQGVPSTRGAVELRDGRVVSWAADFDMVIYGSGGVVREHAHDYSLRVWKPDGTQREELKGHTSTVKGAIALSSGRIVSWDRDGQIIIWHMNLFRTRSKHRAGATGAFPLDGEGFVYWSKNGMVCVCNYNGKVTARYKADAPMTHCVWSQDRRSIATGDGQGRLTFLALS